jgi:hypothetical protein
VQLSSEELIESIKKHNIELIDQINAYETSSILDFNQENKIKLDNFIQEMQGFHTKWNEYLYEFKLDENDIKAAKNEASQCLERIKKENEQFLFKLFNDNLLKFNKNSTETLGSLKKADVQFYNSKNLINLNAHYLPDWCSFNKNEPLLIKLLNNGNISVAYRKSENSEIDVVIFDSNFNGLYQKTCITGRNFKKFQLSAMANNSIIL